MKLFIYFIIYLLYQTNGSVSAANKASQSKDTNNIDFTCPGGCLISFLTILLLGLIFGINKKSIQFHIETYNNKVNGINKTLKKENKSMIKKDGMGIAKEFQINYSTHIPFIMVRFIESFKFIIDKDKFDFTWGIGSSVSGKTDQNKHALLLYKHINLNKSFKNLRNGSTTQIFKDFYNEGKDYKKGKYECFLIEKARGTVDFFHPLFGTLCCCFCVVLLAVSSSCTGYV